MSILVRVKGLSEVMKDLDLTDNNVKVGLREGLIAASDYLRDKIKAKFGIYQSTGGTGGGPWKKLLSDTIFRKSKEGYMGNSNRPLLKTGKTRDSIVSNINKNGKGASVSSDSEILRYHVYGIPKRGLPKRDPMQITSKEEEDAVFHIVEEKILDQVFKDL